MAVIMEALKKIVTLRDNVLNLVLPERFRAKTIELIVLSDDAMSAPVVDRQVLLARYHQQYEGLRFDIRNLKYDRDELHGRD
jgi:hypothetical protein